MFTDDHLKEIELIITAFNQDSSQSNVKSLRKELRDTLLRAGSLSVNTDISIADAIVMISKGASPEDRRKLALVLLRLLGMNSDVSLLPENTSVNHIHRKLATLFDDSIPDIYNRFKIDKNSQTHEKIQILATIHFEMCHKLDSLINAKGTIESIVASREVILKCMSDRGLFSYFQIYGYKEISEKTKAILSLLSEIIDSSAENLSTNLAALNETLLDQLQISTGNSNFIHRNYYNPFLLSVQDAALKKEKESIEKFRCQIVSKINSCFTFEKKLPLHIADNIIRLTLSLHNTGPGSAANVRVVVITNNTSVEIINDSFSLGTVKPGDFVVPISLRTNNQTNSLTIELFVEWKYMGQNDDLSSQFSITIAAQPTDTDWEKLARLQPYSLETATGAEFIGRRDVVRKIVARLSTNNIQSSYITGQKRVGKSSLALAIRPELEGTINGRTYRFIYKECGEFKHSVAEDTLQFLGDQLATELSYYLPNSTQWHGTDFRGSLAPLNSLVDLLFRVSKDHFFVIIIDEFDEINYELYRYGPLAETFFLNLRTLSGKQNLAFILVGGERMPYVISAQGDKLNKFAKESLDSFKHNSEWQDYEDLIKVPVQGHIEWHDSAIRAVFEETNGHPYFTKLICGKVFDNSLLTKDLEVTEEEIKYLLDSLVGELDINMFAHFWKDGIQGGYEEIEIVSLKRCRVLVGYARARRVGRTTDLDGISACHSSKLSHGEIQPILTDFCTRGVMRENNGAYLLVVKLFERWLVDKGVNLLIADQLGEDLAEAKQKEEDKAFVTGEEISSLIKTWPTYRGKYITSEDIRNWLNQVQSHIDQRSLFKLLQNLRFFTDPEIQEKLTRGHNTIRGKLSVPVRKSQSERRNDILITYVDGPGKSGSYYASLYAQANLISTQRIIEINGVSDELRKLRDEHPKKTEALIIVDDFIGTGESLCGNLNIFFKTNGELVDSLDLKVFIIVVCATPDGEDHLRYCLSTFAPENADIFICEVLSANHFAFGLENNLWVDEEEKAKTKSICQHFGTLVSQKNPLGFREQGLLVLFPRNCPNNTLPILHASGKNWKALFPRIK
jgi:hypothetical protein